MQSFGFAVFRDLLNDVEQALLFDAVKPELQDFAKFKFGNLNRNEAFTKVFEMAYAVTKEGGDSPSGNVEKNIVERMGNGTAGASGNYAADVIHGERLFYFFLFSDDESMEPIYAKRIGDKLFGRNFFDEFADELKGYGVRRPGHLPPTELVPLGDISISFGLVAGARTFFLPDPTSAELDANGEIGVLQALDWRSRLSSLHGRTEEYNALLKWALGGNNDRVQLALVSGPGGSGKSRLAADVVSILIRKHSWTGGFLPHSVGLGDIFDGGGKGLAFIIDYPEQRASFVKRLVTALKDNPKCSRPIRIILVTRENLQDWLDRVNLTYVDQIEEVRLSDDPYLDIDDAIQITEDVAADYPQKIDKPKVLFSGVETWLQQHHSHRLPLMTLAASVHAVLEPEQGFTLSAKDVLFALARIERKRVRNYSALALGDRDALEKLLSLALLTQKGLFKDTITALGDANICDGRRGTSLLDAIKKTPFWIKATVETPGHLLRIQPDRPASAFFLLAFDMREPSPSLPFWMSHVAQQSGPFFSPLLSLLAYDISLIDAVASQSTESTAIDMLEHLPNLETVGLYNTTALETGFSTAFDAALGEYLLNSTKDAEVATDLQAQLASTYGHLGNLEKARDLMSEALSSIEQSFHNEPGLFREKYASCLNDAANIFDNSGLHKTALTAIEKCILIMRGNRLLDVEADSQKLAVSLSNYARILVRNNRINEAVDQIEEAIEIQRLIQKKSGDQLEGLAGALNNSVPILFKLNYFDDALANANEALSIRRDLAKMRPDLFLPSVAGSLNNKSIVLSKLRQHDDALVCIREVVEIYRGMAQSRPDIHLVNLAGSLHTHANRLISLEEKDSSVTNLNEAVKHLNEAISIRRSLFSYEPTGFSTDLVMSIHALGTTKMKLGYWEEGLREYEEAIEILIPFYHGSPEIYAPQLSRLCASYDQLCGLLRRSPNEKIIRAIKGN